jgi:hypothetical protein
MTMSSSPPLSLNWNLVLASGIYLARLTVDGREMATSKITMVK